jgi:hypothetical protein
VLAIELMELKEEIAVKLTIVVGVQRLSVAGHGGGK